MRTPRIVAFRALAAALSIGLLALAATGSCKKREAPAPSVEAPTPAPGPTAAGAIRVTDVQLGTALGPDKRVTTPKETFAPADIIFASVSTDGAGAKATLTARWTYQDGQKVSESSKEIAPVGPAVTEFSIQKPGGWPAGEYRVEILLDGQSAATRAFRVQ